MPTKRYYTKCDGCGKKIYLGDPIFYFDGYVATYCSAECFADSYATIKELTLGHIDNCDCELHEEVTDKVTVEKVISDEIITGEQREELFEKVGVKE